jgi:release factor glutamine methyltransferase
MRVQAVTVPMTETILNNTTARLRKAGVESPRLEARLLLAHAMGASQEEIIAGRIAPDAAALSRFAAHVARREASEPLAYIVGKREFWSLDFAVGPGVLIPRPESETLIESALREFPAREAPLGVLDLGTGTGCLLIAFLEERPQATGIGADISGEALAWAEKNLQTHGMANRAHFVRGNWADSIEGKFDVIFCNPPYVTDAARALLDDGIARHEPDIALAGGVDGLDAYRQLAKHISGRLTAKGRAFIEVGKGQAADVAGIFRTSGLDVLRIASDLAQIPRCVVTAQKRENF